MLAFFTGTNTRLTREEFSLFQFLKLSNKLLCHKIIEKLIAQKKR